MQIASFLLYLSDVEEGGETMFPFEVLYSFPSVWVSADLKFCARS